VVAKYPGSRSFARPSGTEDVVRVYVEHKELSVVKEMGRQIAEALKNNKDINN